MRRERPIDRRVAESDRRRGAVLEAVDEGVIVLDADGRVLQANAAASTILAVDVLSDGAGAGWWQALTGLRTEQGVVVAAGAGVLRTGRSARNVEVQVGLADGASTSLSVNYLPWRDADGVVGGLVLAFRDVTEARAADARLAGQQDRLREAYEVAGLSSWEWRPETDEVETFRPLSGAAAAVGTEATLEALLEVMGVGGDDGEGAVHRHRYELGGEELWLETRARAVRDAAGRVLYVCGTSQDVTEQEHARRQSTDVRDFLQATLDSTPSTVAVLDGHGEILMTNRAWVAYAAAQGVAADDLGTNYLDVCDAAVDDDWAMQSAQGLRAVIAGTRGEFSMEYPCHSPGREQWFLMQAGRYEGPGAARAVVVHVDVTHRRQAEARVVTQAALLDEIDVAVVASDIHGDVTEWNRGAEELYGWSRREAVGLPVTNLITSTGRPSAVELGDGSGRPQQGESEGLARHRNGTSFPVLMRDRSLLDARGQVAGAISVSMDLSDRVAADRELLEARNYGQAVADAMGEGLFTLATDGTLVYMNPTAEAMLGWSRDELLGRVMHHVLHPRRADGSTMAIADSPIARASRNGEKVRVEDDVFRTRNGDDLSVTYTAAPFVTDDGVQGCAVVFSDVSERRAREEALRQDVDKLAWIARIQEGLAEDRFVLHAQPIIDMATGEVVQHELLLRLLGEDGQLIAPGEFLAVAEQYGLIKDIDRWVIEQAIAIAARGHAVELNLSARSIGDAGVLEHIERCLRHAGADPALLVFEITETAIVEDQASARAFADRLHALGSRLALDDFGTGYGGFTYLKQIPVDFLKIDVEFVRDLATNPGSRHVVDAVVALAQGFGLQTVAEGVEDAQTMELLRELGVDLAQGFHLGRPEPFAGACFDEQGTAPSEVGLGGTGR